MITKQKGTYDIYGKDAKERQYINEVLISLCEKYNFGYIETPVFEASELFHRGMGDTTDVVTKETYDFTDRGERNLTLRPEGTAGVVRWFNENKLYGNLTDPVKVFYNSKMYRYERPQSGRNREFTQWGFEIFGADSTFSDAEAISLAYNAYQLLGLDDITVKINTLGDTESRQRYHDKLVNYFKPHINELCEDCKERLNKNPLRILDCKVDAGNEIILNAPKTLDYLNEESKVRFEKLKELLDLMEINYEVDDTLVRGLDYYNHVVFEIYYGDSLALGGGGRYNGLVETLGGPSIPGVGFAMGYDRTIQAIRDAGINIPINESIDTFILAVSNSERETASFLTQNLRLNGFITEMDMLDKSLKSQFKSVERMNPKYLIFLNDEDLSKNIVTIKDNITKEEEKVKLNEIVEYLDTHM